MSDLTCDPAELRRAAAALRANRAKAQPSRPIPSIAMCGSDTVIGAFVQAFSMVRQQDANAYSSWANLGDQLQATADELSRVDTALARSFG